MAGKRGSRRQSSRELKIETFQGDRDRTGRASLEHRQPSLSPKFEHQDRSELRRTVPWKTTEEENMTSHRELRELMLICLHATTITTTTTTTLFQYSHVSTWYYLLF